MGTFKGTWTADELRSFPLYEEIKAQIVTRLNDVTLAEYTDGTTWYRRAFLFGSALTEFYGLDNDRLDGQTVLGIMAQGIRWSAQVAYAPRYMPSLVKVARCGGTGTDVKGIGRVNNLPIDRALAYLRGGSLADLLGDSPKIRVFTDNLRGILDDPALDRHAVRVGLPLGASDKAANALLSDTNKLPRRSIIRQVYYDLAELYGLPCAQLQAIAWVVQRRWAGEVDTAWEPFNAAELSDAQIVNAWLVWLAAEASKLENTPS